MEIVSRDYFPCFSKEKRPRNLSKFNFQQLIRKREKVWIIQCSRNSRPVNASGEKNAFFSPELLKYSFTRRIRFHSARYFLNNHFGSSNLGKPVKIHHFWWFSRIFGKILGHLKEFSGFSNIVSRFSTKVSQLDAMEHYSVLCRRFEQKYLIKRAVKM